MRKTVRTLAALTVAAALVAGVNAAATAETSSDRTDNTRQDTYGHTEVRKGIPATAARFPLTSPDVRNGGSIPPDAWANGFGCTGGNQQIELKWSGAPKEARSFAVSMQDVDAPTGSGFWHWMTWDIPADTTSLGRTLRRPPRCPAPTTAALSATSARAHACGDLTHRYKITVYALDTPSLGLAASSTPAVAAFTMSSHVIGYGRITATAQR